VNQYHSGRISNLGKLSLEKLRVELLSIFGIGPETADSIILYAYNKPIFVVDKYTIRLFQRHNLCGDKAKYLDVQAIVHQSFFKDKNRLEIYNEFHALIVKVSKEHCRSNPDCNNCPLKNFIFNA